MFHCVIHSLILFSIIYASNGVVVNLDKSGNVNKEVALGADVTLSCSVSGASNPTVQWSFSQTFGGSGSLLFYDNQIVTENSRGGRVLLLSPYSLTITDTIADQDAGFYTCQATAVPSTDSKYYNLTVIVPPSVPNCGFPSDLAITLGTSSSFTCSASGIPDPTYQWFKNGALLPPNPSGSPAYTNTSYTYNINSGKLTFSSVVSGDAGTYYCKATNKAGSQQCGAAQITTKNVNVGKIVGIVFGVIFLILLIAVLVWWTWKRGYCDGIFEGKEHDMDNSMDEDGANDIVLDGAGPLVHKAASENGKQEASMMI